MRIKWDEILCMDIGKYSINGEGRELCTLADLFSGGEGREALPTGVRIRTRIKLAKLNEKAERVANCAPSQTCFQAERVGFEPTMTTRAITVFETAPFNHSGTSPAKGIIPEFG